MLAPISFAPRSTLVKIISRAFNLYVTKLKMQYMFCATYVQHSFYFAELTWAFVSRFPIANLGFK